MRKQSRLLSGGAVPMLLLCLCVWTLRPMPKRVRTYTADGYSFRVEETRKYELLPPREWSVKPEEIIGCGSNGGTH